jgi:hypothetical protein
MDHLLGLAVAGLLLGWLPAAWRWPVCAGFLGLLGTTHVLWMAPGAGSAYLAGLMFMSASLLAAGMAASRLTQRLTAGAARSRT